jgi:hypothetical protein
MYKDAHQIHRLIRSSILTINSLVEDPTNSEKSEKRILELSSYHHADKSDDQNQSAIKSSSFSMKRFSASENESGFSSMCSFFIPSINEIGLPQNQIGVGGGRSKDADPPEIINKVLWV